MLAISIPMANMHGSDITIIVAATLGGGIFGDHCSPISDTSIISSMASASDHIDHVKTQLPYALIGGTVTVFMYLIIGFFG
jgi:Na+/H+ antiporter NhaC